MTPVQWMFHYREILEQRNRRETWICERVAEAITILGKKIQFAGMLSHPEIDLASLATLFEGEGGASSSIEEDVRLYEEMGMDLPEMVTVELQPKEHEVAKGKIDKNLGIVIPTN